jgi:ADP-ribose pyrophosphatase YjhB (NUDIX family)
LWRAGSDGLQVAVVHRTGHNDCCLPKGKLEPKETWGQCALREVREETGYQAFIRRFAGVVPYYANGNPKIVLFWTMEVLADQPIGDSEAGHRVEWLSVKDALDRMTHEGEKRLLQNAKYGRDLTGGLSGLFAWGRRRGKCSRLERSLLSYRGELAHRVALFRDEPMPEWASCSLALLSAAAEAAERDDVEAGWRCFHAAQRLELFGLSDEELKDRALALRKEATAKIGGWRGEVIQSLLATAPGEEGGSAEVELSPRRVAHARRIRDDGNENTYQQLHLFRYQTRMLLVVLTVLVAVLAAAGAYGFFPGPKEVSSGGSVLLFVALFGALGGCLSALLTLAKTHGQKRIPAQLADSWIAGSRPVLGAATALGAYTFLQAGLIADFNVVGTFAVSFAAGFTERLVIRAVGSVAGGESPGGTSKNAAS